jgi:hypothetical protein
MVHGKVKCGEVNKVEPLIARLHQGSKGKRGKWSLFGYHLIGGQRWEKSLKLFHKFEHVHYFKV